MRKTSKCFTHNHVSEKLKGLEPRNPPLEYIRKKPTVFAIKKPKRKKKEHGTISEVDERSLGLVEKNARDEHYKLQMLRMHKPSSPLLHRDSMYGKTVNLPHQDNKRVKSTHKKYREMGTRKRVS